MIKFLKGVKMNFSGKKMKIIASCLIAGGGL